MVRVAPMQDGWNTACPPLQRLRRSMAMVPQDPTLFQGTVRENLCLVEPEDDVTIWAALERAHAADIVRGARRPHPSLLMTEEEGSRRSHYGCPLVYKSG